MSRIGTKVFIKLATKILAGQTSVSYSVATNMIEISSKESGNESEFAPGRNSRTLSVSGIGATTAETTKEGYYELHAAQEAGTLLAFSITEYNEAAATNKTVGSEIRTGNAYISNLTLDENDNAEISYSCDLQITGAVTIDTNTII